MNKLIIVFFILFQLASAPVQAGEAEATTITTSEIISSVSLDPSCLNYCITGVCVWLFCTIFGCEVETSIQVAHYNPDLVVSVFDEPGENPWTEVEAIFGNLEKQASDSLINLFHDAEGGGGHRTEGGNNNTDQSLRFKEVTAVGHPFSLFDSLLSNTNLFCPSEADPFTPYFSSAIDSLTWRLGLPEMLYINNLIPGRRLVGSGILQQWGAVWPRTGFINQKDDVKAAAVVAQRAGNIVTQTGQPHVYNALNGNGYSRTTLPGELIENDSSTGLWQMLAPKTDEMCYAFGENDVYSQSWSTDRQAEDNRYAFALWRPYECCEDKGIYLFTVPVRICV